MTQTDQVPGHAKVPMSQGDPEKYTAGIRLAHLCVKIGISVIRLCSAFIECL